MKATRTLGAETRGRFFANGVRQARGGLHSAPLLLHSVDFAAIADMQQRGDWAAAAKVLGQAGQGLQLGLINKVGFTGSTGVGRKLAEQCAGTLKRVSMEDVVEADQIFTMLMGEEVEPRRKFIEENAHLVSELDV